MSLLATALILASFTRLAAAQLLRDLLQQTRWGTTSRELLGQFGDAAKPLSRSLDFGDSYVDLVLNRESLGGVRVLVFFQMDKQTGGLKRIQLERPHHGVNPPAYRAITAALHDALGAPDKRCVVPVRPAGGYQAAAQELWFRGGNVVSAIFRDTTLQAFEGCLYGITSGPCGLTGRLLVRISPADATARSDPCFQARQADDPSGSR